ncbi:MAG: nucleoid-associated protein [Chlamydiae bacterium CG10_big_fil_rev_8_21_14_0_10_42_34]|nr:MAG: nucleoid-associated protein [Chlamydiae bacterium CG10_big_fil_rev_8_21_14_0_10_42_34]
MGSGFSKMKKQARLMQDQFSQMKNKLETTLVEGSAGNGLVVVTLNGSKELKKITINPEALSDVEGLQDLILGAFEDAASKLGDENQMPGLPSGMPWM